MDRVRPEHARRPEGDAGRDRGRVGRGPVRQHPGRTAARSGRSTSRRRSARWSCSGTSQRLAGTQPGRGRRRLLPRRRGVRPLHPERGRCRRRPQRVLHRVHALPGRGQPGHAAGGLRVPDADVPAHRPGRRQRQPLRGRVGGRRGGADGARRHRPHRRGAGRRERPPRVPADARDLRRQPELPRADAADARRLPEPGRRGEGRRTTRPCA